MPADKKTIKLQIVVDESTATKIAELAERMGASQSKMGQWLLEAAIDDNEWIIRAVTSRFALAVRDIFSGAANGRKAKVAAT